MKQIATRPIDPQELYTFAAIARRFGPSVQTLYNWRKSGRLVVCPHNPSLVRGDHLLAAIRDKRPKPHGKGKGVAA